MQAAPSSNDAAPAASRARGLARLARTALFLLSCGVLILAVASASASGAEVSAMAQEPAAESTDSPSEASADDEDPAWVEDLLPRYFVEMRFLELALWQWIGALTLLLTASFLGFFAALIVVRAVRWALRRVSAKWPGLVLDALAGPLRLGLSVWIFYLGSLALLALPARSQDFIGTTCEVLALVAATWFALRMVDVGATLTKGHFVERGVQAALTLVPMGVRITKVFVVLIALLSLVNQLGFNVASILAGLGVGGLAIALALQKPLENFFSGITVIMDQPVKVGDFCRIGEHMGTIEDIGLRSTRLRTLDRTLLTIPNSEFASARIESFTARDKMRLSHTLSFGYDTSPDQMRYLLTRIREILHSHPRVEPDPCRVRFLRYGAFSLDVELFAFVTTTDWSEYLGIQENIFLHIHDAVSESGACFAFPSQTLYLGRDTGRDAERTKAAEERVRAWREENRLPFPNLPAERVAEIDDSLPWPPAGAPRAAVAGPQAAAPESPKKPADRKGWWR